MSSLSQGLGVTNIKQKLLTQAEQAAQCYLFILQTHLRLMTIRSHMQVMHEDVLSAPMFIKGRNISWMSTPCSHQHLFCYGIKTLMFCEHLLSKNHLVTNAMLKQTVMLVLWEIYSVSKRYGCKNITQCEGRGMGEVMGEWWENLKTKQNKTKTGVCKAWPVYTRNNRDVVHFYMILITLNNVFPTALN